MSVPNPYDLPAIRKAARRSTARTTWSGQTIVDINEVLRRRESKMSSLQDIKHIVNTYKRRIAELEAALADARKKRVIAKTDLLHSNKAMDEAIRVLSAAFFQLQPNGDMPQAGSRSGQLAQTIESVLGELHSLEAALAEHADTCPDCGSSKVIPDVVVCKIQYGDLGEITYSAPVKMCGECGQQWTSAEHEDAQTTAIIKHLHNALADARDEIKQHDLWREEAERQIAERTKERDALAAHNDAAREVLTEVSLEPYTDSNLACLLKTLRCRALGWLCSDPTYTLAARLAAERRAGKVEAIDYLIEQGRSYTQSELLGERAQIERGEVKP